MFWKKFLRPERGGEFCELGGNGLIGSHTLGLERQHGWTGCLVEPAARPRRQAQQSRSCRTLDSLRDWGGENRLDLLAVHRPQRFPEIWERLRSGRLRPGWVVVENLEPDPQWSRLLERSGYRLRFFFHDDEYFQLTSR